MADAQTWGVETPVSHFIQETGIVVLNSWNTREFIKTISFVDSKMTIV
jgi:hypothetical protein